jgi:hypothetical protein
MPASFAEHERECVAAIGIARLGTHNLPLALRGLEVRFLGLSMFPHQRP